MASTKDAQKTCSRSTGALSARERPRRRSILTAVVAMGIFGCEVDYTAPLVGGYSVSRVNASTVQVGRRSEPYPSAGPLVIGLDVIGIYIAGNAIVPSNSLFLYEPPPVAGYFVIDSSTHEGWMGISKEEFDARCEIHGIVPRLKPPRHFRK